MEILLTLKNMDNLFKIAYKEIDGLVFGGPFSLCFDFDLEQIKKINEYCLNNGVKRYITVDTFICEGDKVALYEYFDFLKEINPDGIYFTDLGVIKAASNVGLGNCLIYDPDTLMTNSLDVNFYARQKIGIVLARELTLEEVNKIVDKNPNEVDMQVFGHLKLSYSKRKFLSNYFKHIDSDVNVEGKRSIRLIEENREYSLPVIEDKYGTRIYSDYILLMYKELVPLKNKLKRVILNDIFIENNGIIFDVARDIRRLTQENAEFLYSNLINKYPNVPFSTGYLYKKTSKVKEGDNE